jgi:hypothetical protein
MEGIKVQFNVFVTSTLDVGKWSAKGDNPDRKASVLQDSWGWAWG